MISMVAMIPTTVYMAAVIKQFSMARLVSSFSLIPTARPPAHLSLAHRNNGSNTHIADQMSMVCGSPWHLSRIILHCLLRFSPVEPYWWGPICRLGLTLWVQCSGLFSCHGVDFIASSIDSFAELFCDPPLSRKFIVMKYGGVLVTVVSIVSSISGFLVAVRWYAVAGMPSFIQMRFFTVPIVASLSVISSDIVLPVGVFT